MNEEEKQANFTAIVVSLFVVAIILFMLFPSVRRNTVDSIYNLVVAEEEYNAHRLAND